MQRHSVAQRCAVLLSMGVVTLSAAACSAAGGASGAGLELVKNKCTTCHSFERVSGASHNRKEWADTVARMRLAGAIMTDAEAATIIEYLSSQ